MGGPGSGRTGGGGGDNSQNHAAAGASGGAKGNSRDSGNHHNFGKDTHGQTAKRGGVRPTKGKGHAGR